MNEEFSLKFFVLMPIVSKYFITNIEKNIKNKVKNSLVNKHKEPLSINAAYTHTHRNSN